MFPPWLTVLAVLTIGPWSPGPCLASRRADELMALLASTVSTPPPESLTVPSMSLFIPPAKLVSLLHGAKDVMELANSTARPQLALEPLLAVLGPEEMEVLSSFFPQLFPPSTPRPVPSILRDGDNDTASNDPILQWLLFGPNASTPPPPPPPHPSMVSLDDSMIVSMLQQMMERHTTTTTTTVKPHLPGPVGIGEEFLATLLQSIHKQQEQDRQKQAMPPMNYSSVLAVVSEVPDAVFPGSAFPAVAFPESVFTTPSPVIATQAPDVVFVESTKSQSTKSQWPSKVKPGGGISDEALMAIIRDVEEINRNISALAGIVSSQVGNAPPPTISTDTVTQILKNVQNLQNSSDDWLISSFNKANISDSANQVDDDTTKAPNKDKRVRPGKSGPTKGSGNKGVRNSPNGLRKRPTRRPSTRTRTTKRPTVWERIVKAAANAFFGTPKPRPGLFQVEDILDLLGSS